MKRALQATKDCYITNRVIRNRFRAIDANVGQAGTLDLFKLADESDFTSMGPFVSGTTEPIELSRVLIKFDLNPLRALTGSILSLDDPTFRCRLQMFDVLGGQPLPSNFTLTVMPLARAFDEGRGRDVYSFEDLDIANFVTASFAQGVADVWAVTGAASLGYAGEAGIDCITGSMQLGDLTVSQTFEGPENLDVDITPIVSATLAGYIPDYGLRISFSSSEETDDRTYFVKRFSSRHSTQVHHRPRILVGLDDSIRDNHENFFFDATGTLYFANYVRGIRSDVEGHPQLRVQLTSGSLANASLFTASYVASSDGSGLYSASFAIPANATGALLHEVMSAHSATFVETWGSLDGSQGFFTGSLVVKELTRSAFDNVPSDIKVNISNLKDEFRADDEYRFRVTLYDDGYRFNVSKFALEAKSLVFDSVHFRVRDYRSDDLVFDFDTQTNSTRLSSDSNGMYFDLHMGLLPPGRAYVIDIKVIDAGVSRVFENVGGVFGVN